MRAKFEAASNTWGGWPRILHVDSRFTASREASHSFSLTYSSLYLSLLLSFLCLTFFLSISPSSSPFFLSNLSLSLPHSSLSHSCPLIFINLDHSYLSAYIALFELHPKKVFFPHPNAQIIQERPAYALRYYTVFLNEALKIT